MGGGGGGETECNHCRLRLRLKGSYGNNPEKSRCNWNAFDDARSVGGLIADTFFGVFVCVCTREIEGKGTEEATISRDYISDT